jgi:HTH-type transcriptional regulator, transcriptional repressor of NAD biosynthesis genes
VSRWSRGLVIGKFRPPHPGHGLLIETALAEVERLTVLVCADDADRVPSFLRANWLRELYPSADVRVVETTGYDADDSRLWAELTRNWLGRAPDVVFTSEAYRPTFARELRCAHVAVDPDRHRVPMRASRILEDPTAYMDDLAPCVRAYFVPRVVLVGAESTGKTTLARALAAHYATVWVPEYGRLFSEGMLPRGYTWATADFVHIAEAQQRLEDQLARKASRVVICDTDAWATSLWHERYLGGDLPDSGALFSRRWSALYLLAGDEIAWEDDGTRDRQAERHWFQNRFRAALDARRVPVVSLEGSPEQRQAVAVAAIDRMLANPTTLS